MSKKRILVAPLNWGLGHATRCIPIIQKLEQHGYEPVLASDGPALLLLKQEFPYLRSYELPSYNITYTTHRQWLKLKLMLRTPAFFRVIQKERRLVKKLVQQEGLSGIISDERPGIRYKKIPSVLLTHQLNVLSGSTTYFTTTAHQLLIKRFDQCWVPDTPGTQNLSGKLGHGYPENDRVRYLGTLSRFKKKETKKEYDITVVLSGPEPQRTLLEKKLLSAFQHTRQRILLIRGLIQGRCIQRENRHIQIENFLSGTALEQALNASKLIISRSGYSSVMDLASLEKTAFFIPTPGQYEQEYLAARLKQQNLADSCEQGAFHPGLLHAAFQRGPLSTPRFSPCFSRLFTLFESK